MKNNKALLTIFLIVFIDLMGFGLILPLLPFIAERFNASPQQIGLLAATYSLFQFIAGPILGRLSDKYGRKRLLVISQFGTCAGFVLLALADSLPLLFVSRIIDGITGGNISIAQAYMADVTSKEERTRGMGMLGAAFGLGFIIGPSLGGFLSRGGYTLPALVAAGVSAVSMIVTSLFLKETVSNTLADSSAGLSWNRMKEVVKDKELQRFAVIFFLLNLSFSAMQGIFALWAQVRLQWDAQTTGYLLGFVGIVSVISQVKILPAVNIRLGELKTMMAGIPLMALGFFGMAIAPQSLYVYISNILLVMGNSFAGPTLQSLATKEVHETEYGGTMGLLHAAGSLARIAGPAAAGFAFAIHPNVPLISAAFVAMTALIFIPHKRHQ